jgi:hypothetical protein
MRDRQLPIPFILIKKQPLYTCQKQNAILILSGVHAEYQSLDLLPVTNKTILYSLDYQIANLQDETKTVLETLAKIDQVNNTL